MGITIVNNKGLVFKNAFYAIIGVSMVIIAVGIIVGEWSQPYQSGITYDLGEYNQLDSVAKSVNKSRAAISPNDGDSSETSQNSILRATFGIIADIFAPFRIVFGNGGMIDSVTDKLGIPDYVRGGLILMMTVALTWAVIALIFRTGGTTA